MGPRLDHLHLQAAAINDPYYGAWKVKTFGNTYSGTVTLTRATLASDNSVYAQLILDVGPKAVCGAAKLLGIMTKLDCYRRGPRRPDPRGHHPRDGRRLRHLASGGVRHRPTGIEKVVFPTARARSSPTLRASA